MTQQTNGKTTQLRLHAHASHSKASAMRSKMFAVHNMVNPLVAAASPLLALAAELRHTLHAPPADELQILLRHEIQCFMRTMQTHGYDNQMIFAARYLLCALIDEVLTQTNWGSSVNWSQQQIAMGFQPVQWNSQQFFSLLEESNDNPSRNMELVELCYFCLSQGFKGQYRHHPNAHDYLNELFDRLFHTIRNRRGELSSQLVVATDEPKRIKRRKPVWRVPPMVSALFLTSVIIAAAFFFYDYKLNQSAAPLLHVLAKMEELGDNDFSGSTHG